MQYKGVKFLPKISIFLSTNRGRFAYAGLSARKSRGGRSKVRSLLQSFLTDWSAAGRLVLSKNYSSPSPSRREGRALRPGEGSLDPFLLCAPHRESPSPLVPRDPPGGRVSHARSPAADGLTVVSRVIRLPRWGHRWLDRGVLRCTRQPRGKLPVAPGRRRRQSSACGACASAWRGEAAAGPGRS